MAKNGVTHAVCGRYFQGEGCRACPLRLVCDRQGYVPPDYATPALHNEPGVRVKFIRPEEPTPPDSEAPIAA